MPSEQFWFLNKLKLEAKYGRLHVNEKIKTCWTFTVTRDIPYIVNCPYFIYACKILHAYKLKNYPTVEIYPKT